MEFSRSKIPWTENTLNLNWITKLDSQKKKVWITSFFFFFEDENIVFAVDAQLERL